FLHRNRVNTLDESPDGSVDNHSFASMLTAQQADPTPSTDAEVSPNIHARQRAMTSMPAQPRPAQPARRTTEAVDSTLPPILSSSTVRSSSSSLANPTIEMETKIAVAETPQPPSLEQIQEAERKAQELMQAAEELRKRDEYNFEIKYLEVCVLKHLS